MPTKEGMSVRWCVTEAMPEMKLEEWARSAAIGDDGTVYVPAAIADHEAAVMLCAMWSAEYILIDDDHLYVSSDWMAREYPNLAALCELIRSKVTAHFAGTEAKP